MNIHDIGDAPRNELEKIISDEVSLAINSLSKTIKMVGQSLQDKIEKLELDNYTNLKAIISLLTSIASSFYITLMAHTFEKSIDGEDEAVVRGSVNLFNKIHTNTFENLNKIIEGIASKHRNTTH